MSFDIRKQGGVLVARLGRYAAVTGAALALTALCRLVLHANQTTVALSYLVLVIFIATRWRLASSVYMSILCAGLYNFFFLPPVGTFVISDPQNWVTLTALLSASVLVSHLSERERRLAELSEARRVEVERLYEFSQQLLLQEDIHSLARLTPAMIASVFHLRAVALYLADENQAYFSDPDNSLLTLEDIKSGASPAQQSGSSPLRLVPLSLGLRRSGTLAMTPGSYSEGIYEAIGGLVAIALARAAAVERVSRAQAAQESERLRSALLDSVTHELRTPLTAIRAAATILNGSSTLRPDERRELYAVVDEESLRLNALIGQAVEMAQLDTSSLQVRLTLRRLADVIDLALEDCHTLLRSHPVTVDIPPDLPEIPMDRELVRRVLRHIIENAAKYSPSDSPIMISAETAEGRMLVHIVDRGPGIDEHEQSLIFDKFYRGARTSQRVHGTGMGLAIVSAILRAHGGGIGVESHSGEGSTFTLWLPLAYPES